MPGWQVDFAGCRADADSTDRRNTPGKFLCWRLILQGLSRPLVDLSGDSFKCKSAMLYRLFTKRF